MGATQEQAQSKFSGTTAAVTSLLGIVGTVFGLAAAFKKSPQQISAEYTLGEITNNIESAMDLNRFCFWTGLQSLNEALQNYQYLWSTLVETAGQVGQLSPAQASRCISERDYGGIYAQEWRWQFRDQMIEETQKNPSHFTADGQWVLPTWWWSWPERAKFTETAPTSRLLALEPYPTETPAELKVATMPVAEAARAAEQDIKQSVGAYGLILGAVYVAGRLVAKV